MIHIILLILKIIGIILLSILGLLLLILLVVLLVPVRYKIDAQHGEDVLKADVRVHWLLHIFRARVSYLEGELKIKVRILCFLLFDNQKPKQEEKKQFGLHGRINNKKKEKSLKKKKTFKETSRQDKKKKNKELTTKKTGLKQPENQQPENQQLENQQLDINSDVVKSKDIAKERIKDDIKTMVETPEGSEEADKKIVDVVRESVEATVKKVEDIVTEDIPPMPEDTIEEDILSEKKEKYKAAKGKRKSFGMRIELIWQRLKSIKASFIKWINWVKEWGTTVSSWKNKLDTVINFFKDKVTKEGLKETYASLKKLLRHIAPTKLKSTIIFGTGDPCSTGQALGMIGILYSFYGDKVKIIPDFEKKVLEGQHEAKGRIRLLTILIIAIKLLVNKKFQLLKENFQRLKEAL
ncbi:MAG: DUF2953 domain-containing protein [Mobilitalea sp.]